MYDNYNAKAVEIVSLCELYYEEVKGEYRLRRLADVNEYNKIETYQINDSMGQCLDNRTSIPCTKLISPEENRVGEIGIWKWLAEPKENGGDYVKRVYKLEQKVPILICMLHAKNMSDLQKKMHKGVKTDYRKTDIMFCFGNGDGTYTGLFCKKENIEEFDGGIKVKDEIVTFKKYIFNNKDLFLYNGEKLRKIFLKSLDVTTLETDLMEVIREEIQYMASWNYMKKKGYKKTQYKEFGNFIEKMQTDDLYEKIKNRLDNESITIDDIEKNVKLFAEKVINYDNNISINNDVLYDIVENNIELKKKCEDVVRANWEKDHAEEVKKYNFELSEIDKKIRLLKEQRETYENDINELQTKAEQLKKECDTFEENLKSKKEMAASIENSVVNKIAEARNNVAEFVADVIFKQGFNFGTNTVSINKAEQIGSGLQCDDVPNSSYLQGEKLKNCTESNDWKDIFKILSNNLKSAGVDEYAKSFAAFLYACFINESPLVLAGPNGEAIANAFSAAFFGKKAGVLNCDGEYDHRLIEKMLNGDDDVVVIKNLFNCNWINRITDLFSLEKKKFYILINPFAADLLIEPRGLYNYVLPVMTELIVDTMPKSKFTALKKSDDFKGYDNEDIDVNETIDEYKSVLEKMNVGKMTAKTMCIVIAYMRDILNGYDDEGINIYDYMYTIFPYAYLTNKSDTFTAEIENIVGKKGDNIKERMLAYFGEKL